MSDSKILLDPRDGTVKLHGADAVRKAEEILGRPLTYIEKRVVEEEGYSESPYDDFGGTKTTKTQGFGYTGEFIGRSFEDVLGVHVDRVRRLIPSYDDLPEELQAELVQSAYRGGITGSPKTVELINAGDWEGASKEFLDHENYRTSKKGNSAIANRMERVSNAMKAHQPVPVGWRQDGPGETPYDPTDRGEMKEGFRHEFDMIQKQADLMDPKEAEGLLASTGIHLAPEPEVAPAPTPEAAPEVAPAPAPEKVAVQGRDIGDMLGFDETPVDLDIRAARARKVYTAGDAIAEQQAKKDHVNPGLWDIFKASGRVDNTTSDLIGVDPSFKIERDFDSQKFWKENEAAIDAMHGIDRIEASEEIGSATSTAEAQFRLKQMQQDYADEQLLLDAGMKALIPRMAMSVLDPVDLGVTLATLPVSGGASSALKLGRMGKILTGAVTAATATGATEAVLARNNAFRDETDVAFAIAAGFTLGGALSSLSRAENGQLQDIVNDVANGELDAAAAKLGIDSAGAKRVAHGSDEPTKPLAPKQTQKFDDLVDDLEDPKFRFKGVQMLMQNFQNTLFYSQSSKVRKLAAGMLEGGFLKGKNAVRGVTAELRANHIRRVFETGVFSQTLDPFKKWAKRNGHVSVKREFSTSVGEEFYSEVGRAMRGAVDGLSPEALEAAASIRPFMDNLFELAENAGVKGFDKPIDEVTGVATNMLEDYFPRMLNKNSFEQKVRTVGVEGLQKWYREAIIAGNEGIGEGLATKIAKGYVHTMRHKVAGLETDLLNGIRLDDIEKMREMFEGYPELDELITELENLKLKENQGRGTVSYAKRRIQFDENFEAPMRTLDGEEKMVKFHEMYENDARKVLKRYSHIMSANIGMAQELGIGSRREFEDIGKAIMSEAEASGGDMIKAAKEVEALNESYNLMMGMPIEPNPSGTMSQLARTGTAYTYATRGGQFGVNALAETGRIIGSAGIRNFLRSIPEWRSMMKRAADGTLDHDLARTAEMLFAPGIHTLTGVAIRNLDELGEGFEGGSKLGRAQQFLDPYLKSAGRATSIMSGLGPITDITQRIAGTEYLRKIARFANGKKMSKGQIARMRANGITEEMQERIFAQFREGAAGVYRKGRLVDLDPAKWADDEALDMLNLAATREFRSVIQENDISTVTKYFHHPLGRVLLQFMRFPMEAVNKQLLHGVHFADGEATKGALASLFIGSTVYMAQTAIEYANDPKERKKRLDPANIARVGFMRTGFSSMIPPIADNLMYPFGIDPMFALGRSSGLGTQVHTANPLFKTVGAAGKGGFAITRSLLSDDIQFSRGDARNLASLLPGHRFLGMKNAIHAIEEAFPEERAQ